MGLWALGTLLPSWLGDHRTAARTSPALRAVAGAGPVHGRLRVWVRGRLVLTDVRGRRRCWIAAALAAAADRVAAAAPRAAARPALAQVASPAHHFTAKRAHSSTTSLRGRGCGPERLPNQPNCQRRTLTRS